MSNIPNGAGYNNRFFNEESLSYLYSEVEKMILNGRKIISTTKNKIDKQEKFNPWCLDEAPEYGAYLFELLNSLYTSGIINKNFYDSLRDELLICKEIFAGQELLFHFLELLHFNYFFYPNKELFSRIGDLVNDYYDLTSLTDEEYESHRERIDGFDIFVFGEVTTSEGDVTTITIHTCDWTGKIIDGEIFEEYAKISNFFSILIENKEIDEDDVIMYLSEFKKHKDRMYDRLYDSFINEYFDHDRTIFYEISEFLQTYYDSISDTQRSSCIYERVDLYHS